MNPLARDLDHVLAHTGPVWRDLRDATLFVSGGTGFFGCWLLESWAWAWEHGLVDGTVTVLTRDSAAFRAKAPHLAMHRAVRLLEGDVRTFRLPKARFTHVIHAAADATPRLCAEQPELVASTILEGTRRILELAQDSAAKRLLFTSSGAVYGPQHAGLDGIPEAHPLAPRGVYGESKAAAEALCDNSGVPCVIARAFAFVGPYLPLDAHFAIGNFLRDRIEGRPIRVNGDGTAVRSYLYAADLAAWLWTLLVLGNPGRAYNVGSERAISIAGLACTVAGDLPVGIAQTPDPRRTPERYFPSCERARRELNLQEWIPLEDAIERTLAAPPIREEAL